MKSIIKNKKFIIVSTSTLIIILIIGSILLFNKGNIKTETNDAKDITSNYTAYIKINPSIKLEYTQTCKQVEKDSDNFDCEEPIVSNYELINDDAKNIYKDIDLLGSSQDLFKVLNLICETARENGIVFEKVDIYTDWDKIENYILFKDIVDYDKVRQKIIECFNCEDIYSRLFELWNKTIEFTNKKNGEKAEENIEDIEDSEDDNDKKKKAKKKILLYLFNKLLMNLNCFTPKVIKNTKDNSFKEQISETIFTNIQLVKEIEDGENFLYYFSEVFDVKEILKNKFTNEHKDITVNYVSNYLVFGLHIIRIFDLQDLFPIEKIFKIISDNYYNVSYLIYSLLAQIYIKNDETKKYLVLDNIFKLLQEEKNIAQYNLVYELVNKDFQNDEKKSEIIKKFMSLIRINLEKTLNMYTVDQATYYCKLIFENSDLFDEEQIKQTKKFICNYFNNLKEDEWTKNLSKLNRFEYKDLKGFLDTKSLLNYFYSLPLEKIEAFAKILKFLPDETDKLLKELSKKRMFNEGLRLIKMLKLPDEEIPLIYKEERMKLFFHYKIKTCEEEDNPHNLIEYCLISKQTFDASIKKILNRYYNGDKYNYYYLYVINEIYYGALNRKIKMSKSIKKEIEDIYYNLKYKDKYSFDDYFGPIGKDCMKIDKNKTKVFFIDDIVQLDKILNQYLTT